MNRFLPIGRARVSVVGGFMHDRQEAQLVGEAIVRQRPQHVIVERSVAEWTAMHSDAYQQRLCELLPRVERDVLWRAVAEATRQSGSEVVLLHRDAPPVPADGLRQLDKLLAREGFESRGNPKLDLMNLHEHYVRRIPALTSYIDGRRDAAAARLRAALETRPDRVMAVLPWPDGDAICDRVQQWAG